MKWSKKLEASSPWILLIFTLLLWQAVCTVFSVSDFIFPSPTKIAQELMQYSAIIGAHACRTYWVTMAGFGIAIVTFYAL